MAKPGLPSDARRSMLSCLAWLAELRGRLGDGMRKAA
jgi:hypothetical protein